MTKIENWSRSEIDEDEKTPYVWEYDNSDRIIQETDKTKPVQVKLYKIDEGVYNVFTTNGEFLPRGFKDELKVNQDATVKQYTKEEGRQAIVDYLKKHPMRLKMIGYDALEKRLDKMGTTDEDKDIQYFLENVMSGFGRSSEYQAEKLQGSGQYIIYDRDGEKVYDSENMRLSRGEALALAQDIVDSGGGWVIDHNLEEKYQRKTIDDVLDETLFS